MCSFCGETECCFYFVEYVVGNLKELGKKVLSNRQKLGKEYVNTYYLGKCLQFNKIDSETQVRACSGFTLIGTWGQIFNPVFMEFFHQFYRERALHKVLWRSCHVSRSYKVTKFWIQRKWFHTQKCTEYFTPGFLCIFC